MIEINNHSLKVLESTFGQLTKTDLEMIRILLAQLSIIRDYKNNPTVMYVDGLRKKDTVRRYMVIYLAVATLMKKDNKRILKKFTKVDLRSYNSQLYRKMIKINQVSYDHFKNVLELNKPPIKEVL